MASFSILPALRHPAAASYLTQMFATQRLPALLRPLNLPAAFQPRQIPQVALPAAFTAFSNLSSFFSELWDCVLRAVPKKKTPYGKKRSRQLAGKALKDVTHLNHCSGCGRIKRMHILCPHCVSNIKDMWAKRLTEPVSNLDATAGTTTQKKSTSSSTEVTAATKQK